ATAVKGRAELSAVFLVPDARGLAGEVTEVEEARAADDALRDELDLVDARAVHEEDALHTDVEAHLAHGERAAQARAVPLEHDALEDLDALLLALDDLVVNADRVSDAEL